MGCPKPLLPFGNELLIERMVRLVGSVVRPVVVVAAPGQQLPELPAPAWIVHDRQPDRGPLEGMAAGLSALGDAARAAFVTACDLPLLEPAVIGLLADLLAGYDAVVPSSGRFDEPLLAVYDSAVLPQIEALLAGGQRRPAALFPRVRTLRVPLGRLREVDPQLRSLRNVNSPDDYRRALQLAGLGDPSDPVP